MLFRSQVGNLGGNPGDPVTYTIVIQQDAASSTDAFAATLTDVIPPEIASPVLTSVVDTAVPAQVTTGNFLLSGNTLTTITPFNVEKDSARTITLQIDGVLQGNFIANQVISNTSSIEWTSLGDSTHLIRDPNNPNSSNAYERTGKGKAGKGQSITCGQGPRLPAASTGWDFASRPATLHLTGCTRP